MIEKGVSHVAYFRLDGGSSKLYTQEYVDEKDKEIEKLHSIIKEVREHIENNKYWNGDNWNCLHCENILEILDKENK